MNNVVATYAPKHYHYSSYISLQIRTIAIGSQILDHFHFWSQILARFDIPMYLSIEEYLKKRDLRRERKIEKNRLTASKLKRSEKLRQTIKKEMKADVDTEKQGKMYTSSAIPDVKAAKKAVRESM